MRESPRNKDLILPLGGKQHARPFPEVRGADSYVHGNIQRFSFHHAAKLGLGMPQLVMKAAQRALHGTRVVVLDKKISDPQVRILLLVVRLQEEAPRVADDFWLEFPDLRKRSVQFLQASLFLSSCNAGGFRS